MSGGAAVLIVSAALYPPWTRVSAERRQVLYWSEEIKVSDSRFVGYDFLFANAKWQSLRNQGVVASEQIFSVTEYRVAWSLLWLEWVLIGGAAVVSFFVVSRRLRLRTTPESNEVPAPRPAAS
jgi:hypothetical protein